MAGFQTKKFKRMNKGTLTQDFLSSFEREVDGHACSKNQGRDHILCFVPTQEAS